jgi:ubiquinone/menaquinone biosynthesis C-methylase UbiE
MSRVEPFEKYYKKYDNWFEEHQSIYFAELKAVSKLVPPHRCGIEIGVGTGRFALPLDIKFGIDPSDKMTKISHKKGIEVCKGIAENLPLHDEIFDFFLFVTTICFLDDLKKSIKEAYRVLKHHGSLIIGFIDKHSEYGKQYQIKRKKSVFYQDAVFYSAEEILNLLTQEMFEIININQTVFPTRLAALDTIEDGYGRGSFIVIKANKNS